MRALVVAGSSHLLSQPTDRARQPGPSDDGFLNLMTSDGGSKDDVKVPEGTIGDEITAGFEEGKDLAVTIVSAMGEEQAVSFKVSSS